MRDQLEQPLVASAQHPRHRDRRRVRAHVAEDSPSSGLLLRAASPLGGVTRRRFPRSRDSEHPLDQAYSEGMKIGIRKKSGVRSSLATLYLPPDATAEDAKRAYRGLVRTLHPDSAGSAEASAELSAVIAAYEYLERTGWLAEHAHHIARRNGQLLDIRA